jgi:hypothetical protein
MKTFLARFACCLLGSALLLAAQAAPAKPAKPPKPPFVPPALADGAAFYQGTGPLLIARPATLSLSTAAGDVAIAETAPTVTFVYYPGQTHQGQPWSAWGEGVVHEGRYYSAVGDHRRTTNLYAYDPATHELKIVLELAKLFAQPDDAYLPGKVHARLAVGHDGWLYFQTHNGGKHQTEQYRYAGDWIARYNVATGQGEVLAQGPVGLASMPTGLTDPQRLIVYAGTEQQGRFFAYDVASRQVVYRGADDQGPTRCILFDPASGSVYWRPRGAPLMWHYDPAKRTAEQFACPIDPRAATAGTDAAGHLYAIDWAGDLWRFTPATRASERLGHAAISANVYITSMEQDPTGRYLYYAPGAHGGAYQDGTPVLQYDLQTGRKKVIAFLAPYLEQAVGYTPIGTYSVRLSAAGDRLFITWMGDRHYAPARQGRPDFDVCALTVVDLPASERSP